MLCLRHHLNLPLLQSAFRLFSVVAVFPLVFQLSFGQEPKNTPDRRKTFGESLKKFVNKPEPKLFTPAPATAKNTDDVIRVQTTMVLTDVLVANAKGNAIAGLDKDDFVITENGVQQDVELFSSGGLPKSIVFIVEVGSIPSMTDKSLEAAKVLVDRLAPMDRMAIVNTNTQLVLDFTSDKKLLKSTLGKLKREFMAGRHNYSSLLASLGELFGPDDPRPIVINQSYGDELAALKPMWEINKRWCARGIRGMCERNFSFLDVIDAVERSRATIYTVVPGPQFIGGSKEEQVKRARTYLDGYLNEIGKDIDRTEADKEKFKRDWLEREILEHIETEKALIQVTTVSGGITNFLEKPQDASDVYDSILKVIENRYIIGYYPKDETRDGKRRTVKIEVRGHPEYVVLGRKSYFAPLDK